MSTSRPIIIVDLDNVLADWNYQMRRACDMYLGIPMEATEIPPDRWEVWDAWGIPKGAFMRAWRRGVEDGWLYRDAPLIGGPEAVAALWTLSDMEFDIQIATSRLNVFGLHHDVITQTADWLQAYGLPFRGLSLTDRKTMTGFAIVDDKPANVVAADVQLRFLWTAPHNEGPHEATLRVHGWDDVLYLLSEHGYE